MTYEQTLFYAGVMTCYLVTIFMMLGSKHLVPDHVILGRVVSVPLFAMGLTILGMVVYNVTH